MKVSSQSLSDQHNVTTCECCVTYYQQYLYERGLAGTSHTETCWFTSTTGARGLYWQSGSRWISAKPSAPARTRTHVATIVLAVCCTLLMQSLINQLHMRNLDTTLPFILFPKIFQIIAKCDTGHDMQ